MKIQYTYYKYKDFPDATEISQSRARSGILLSTACFLGIFLTILLWVASPENWLSSILIILFLAALLVYVIIYYPKVTEKKIRKSIENTIKARESVTESRFKCKHIKIHYDKRRTDTCFVCFAPNVPLKLCDIQKEDCTRNIYICDSCIAKFKANL